MHTFGKTDSKCQHFVTISSAKSLVPNKHEAWFMLSMGLFLDDLVYLSNWEVLLLWPSHAETASNWFSFGFLSFFFFLSFLSFLSSLSFFFFFFLSLLVLPSSWSSFWFGVISIDSTRWIFSSFQVTLLRSEGELRPSRPVSERIVS